MVILTLKRIIFVLQRVKEYLLGSSLVCKLQAKHDHLKVAVEKGIASENKCHHITWFYKHWLVSFHLSSYFFFFFFFFLHFCSSQPKQQMSISQGINRNAFRALIESFFLLIEIAYNFMGSFKLYQNRVYCVLKVLYLTLQAQWKSFAVQEELLKFQFGA